MCSRWTGRPRPMPATREAAPTRHGPGDARFPEPFLSRLRAFLTEPSRGGGYDRPCRPGGSEHLSSRVGLQALAWGTAGAYAISGGGPARRVLCPVFQTEDERGHALLGATEELVECGAKRVNRLRGRWRGLAGSGHGRTSGRQIVRAERPVTRLLAARSAPLLTNQRLRTRPAARLPPAPLSHRERGWG
jgi:hypothetical protein